MTLLLRDHTLIFFLLFGIIPFIGIPWSSFLTVLGPRSADIVISIEKMEELDHQTCQHHFDISKCTTTSTILLMNNISVGLIWGQMLHPAILCLSSSFRINSILPLLSRNVKGKWTSVSILEGREVLINYNIGQSIITSFTIVLIYYTSCKPLRYFATINLISHYCLHWFDA